MGRSMRRKPLGEAKPVSNSSSHGLNIAGTHMNESRSNQHTGTEVLAEEEYWRWDLHPLDLFCYDWKPSTEDGSKKHNDCQ
jgi:hypothetical protein